ATGAPVDQRHTAEYFPPWTNRPYLVALLGCILPEATLQTYFLPKRLTVPAIRTFWGPADTIRYARALRSCRWQGGNRRPSASCLSGIRVPSMPTAPGGPATSILPRI